MTKPTLKLVRCHRGADASEVRSIIAALTGDLPAMVRHIPKGSLKGCVQVCHPMLGAPPWSVFKLAPKRGPVLEFKVCIRVRA